MLNNNTSCICFILQNGESYSKKFAIQFLFQILTKELEKLLILLISSLEMFIKQELIFATVYSLSLKEIIF